LVISLVSQLHVEAFLVVSPSSVVVLYQRFRGLGFLVILLVD